MTKSTALAHAIDDLVTANRILAHEGVVDAYGHVSCRHPTAPQRYLLSCSRSPELVRAEDIVELDMDGHPIDKSEDRPLYAERAIHSSIYRARPDVGAVCHNHAHSLIPWSVSAKRMHPIFHFAAAIGPTVPVWDMRTDFGDNTNLLVTSADHGDSLARTLGGGRACLMRGHGSVVAAHDVRAVVLVAISLMQNAALLLQACALGPVTELSEGEIAALEQTLFVPLVIDRGWEYWRRRAAAANAQ